MAIASIKRLIRAKVGVWPAMEWRNRLVMGRRALALARFENEEVKRLHAQLGGKPSATVACIMPTYKRPQLLLKAVESILKQDFQDFVVMIVDDGAGLPNLPADPRVFSVSLSRNSAVLGLVRNVGIRLTESRFLAFLDDDNTWTPQHLTLTLGALRGGADLVYTAVRRRTVDGRELDVLSRPFDRRSFSDETNYVDANSIALRRTSKALFSRLPRVKTTFPKEDWEFVYRQSMGARVEHIPVATVEYLVNLDSFYTTWE